MAGMFYSLEEAAEKLNKTEDEVKELVKAGRLREFRDGPNLLFKVDEIESLMSDTTFTSSEKSSKKPPEAEEEKAEKTKTEEAEETKGQEQISLEPEGEETSVPEGEETSVPEETKKPEEKKEPEKEQAEQTKGDEVSLSEKEAEETPTDEDITSADTAITSEGINVLGETDSDYPLSADTKAETQAESGEASLEEIEEDVNLDSFGSGSGLLDLSLQADDTSLGGILDDIYTSEEGEEEAEGSAADVAAEADEMIAEEPAPQAPVAAGRVQAYSEPAPDTLSNAFGLMLFLPLLAIIYTAIVIVTGFSGTMPTILQGIQGFIWYIVIGVAAASCLIVGVAFMLSAGGGKISKPKKAKKQKKEKATQPPAASEAEQEKE